MRVAPAVATIYFALVIVAQWNDPDPLVWTACYTVALVLSAGAAFGRHYLWPTAIACAGYTIGAVVMLPALAHLRLAAFTSVAMASMEDERVREAIGLLVAAAWTAWLLRDTLRGRS